MLPSRLYLDLDSLDCGVNAYTCEWFKNYKSLEADQHFTNSWVQDLFSFWPRNNYIWTEPKLSQLLGEHILWYNSSSFNVQHIHKNIQNYRRNLKSRKTAESVFLIPNSVMTAMAYVDETKDDTHSTPYLQKPKAWHERTVEIHNNLGWFGFKETLNSHLFKSRHFGLSLCTPL